MRSRALAAAVLGLLLLGAGPAWADHEAEPRDCPDPPVEYTGTDDVVSQLVALRSDLRATCLSARSHSEHASIDSEAVRSSIEALATTADSTDATLARWLAPSDPSDPSLPSLHALLTDANAGSADRAATLLELRDTLEALSGAFGPAGTAHVNLRGVDADAPLPVSSSVTNWPATSTVNVEGVDPVALGDKAEAVNNNLNATLWFLVGLATVGLVGYTIARQVMPR